MKEIMEKKLSPTEIIERTVDSFFGTGHEVFGNERVEITILPEFSRGEIVITANGNKLYKHDENGKYGLEVPFFLTKAEAIEEDFSRYYTKLHNVQFVKIENMCSFVGLVVHRFWKNDIDFCIRYMPYEKYEGEPYTLFANEDVDAEKLLERIKLLVKEEGEKLVPEEDFKDILFQFVFK